MLTFGKSIIPNTKKKKLKPISTKREQKQGNVHTLFLTHKMNSTLTCINECEQMRCPSRYYQNNYSVGI